MPLNSISAATSAAGFRKKYDAARTKQRSKHNTFTVVPVVFTMISNHFPTASYGSAHARQTLAVLVGWAAAAWIRRA